MRFIVYGAGAIGGVIGGRLAVSGHEVVLIARGAHYEAIRDHGLRVVSPEGVVVVDAPVVDTPEAIELQSDDVVLLTMKSQHTDDALAVLGPIAPPGVSVVCAQNGVANERAALRRFANVHGVCVMCPAVHLEPGVVEANAAPIAGILDVGCYPAGCDDHTDELAAAFAASTFVSEPRPDIMRWKYAKLVNNLGNAVDALCGRVPGNDLARRARAEANACLDAAGIDRASHEEDTERRGDIIRWGGPEAQARGGSSSWQSLARGTGSIEADYLNGEIVLLGRLHGVPTPVNATLQRLASRAAREGWAPGSMSPDAVIRMVTDAE